MDENGQAYIYRVRYILDNNMQFTKVYSSPQYSDQNALHMNLLSRDFSSNNQLSGITCSVTLVSRKDNQNYYGQLYQSTAYNQDRMDLAVQDKPKELSTGTGLNTDIWFIATGFSGLFLLIIMKKRKEKTKGD